LASPVGVVGAGIDIRDGFLLAVKLNGGKPGGPAGRGARQRRPKFKPDVAKQQFEEHQARQGRP
jgi:hypothetical protein